VAGPRVPPDSRHFVVHNPSTMPKLAPVMVRRNNIFVYVGRFTLEKQPVAFAHAARSANVRAVLLGAGPEQERIRRANP
jgi:glycosyltransferase involved in cell wall biosynthesis